MSHSTRTPRGEQYPRRLHDLEQRFGALFTQLEDSPQKEALSILHGISQELWRQLRRSSSPLSERGLTIHDIADLYRHAPKMEGQARNAPLPPGTRAPEFALPDASGRLVRLSDFRGNPFVLVFYPLDWSPGCSQQLDLYQHELDEFERRGAKVVGISVDSVYSHGAWAAVRGITFPLLADFNPKGDVARKYHVYRDIDGFSERAVYVVDGDGVIRYSDVSPFVHHIPDIYELFKVLDSLKTVAPAPMEVTT
jgi:peroxiredoxin